MNIPARNASTQRRRRRTALAAAVAGTLLLAACGSSSTTAAAPSTSSASAFSAAATTSAPPTAGSSSAMTSSAAANPASSAPDSSAPASSGTGGTVNAAAVALLPDSIKSSKVLNDGVNVPNPPMESQVTGGSDFTGFDVDLAKAIAARLGLTVDFKSLQFAALLTSLDSGRVDIVFSGLFDTAKRQAKYDIIDYFNTGAAIFTTKANAAKAPDLPSLCGQNVETAVGTAFAAQIATLSDKICAGKSPIKVVEVGGSLAEEILQITTGRAIAAITTPENLGYLNTQTPNTYVAVGEPFNPVPYGIQVTKANTGLRDALVMAFKDVIADGTYKSLLAKYNLQSGARDSVTVNAG